MPKISSEDKQKIREKNYANILKKLRDGKTLTKYENDLLDEMSEENQGSTNQTYYDSMAQAAKALGVEVSVLKRVKRQGAPGFRGSRVYIEELLPWLTEHLNGNPQRDSKEELEIRKIKGQCEKIEFDLDLERSKYIELSQVQEDLQTALASQRSILSQRLLNEYPSQVAGLSPEQGRIYAKRLFDQLCLEMQHIADRYGSKTG